MLGDNVEVIIMSDTACDDDCGAVRPGTVAYRELCISLVISLR